MFSILDIDNRMEIIDKNTVNFKISTLIKQYFSVFDQVAKQILGSEKVLDLELLYDRKAISSLFLQSIDIDLECIYHLQLNSLAKQVTLWKNINNTLTDSNVKSTVIDINSTASSTYQEFQENLFFNYIKQSYLLSSSLIQDIVESVSFKDKRVKSQLKFLTRQYLNAINPSNFIFTNPEVYRELINTNGQSLVKGLEHYKNDLNNSPTGILTISQVKPNSFMVGKNLAYTAGNVIFQNELFQLIQYKANTDTVKKEPVLFVPPFINKYYILDMNEKNSLVNWLVKQGFTVFMMSWVNPDESSAKLNYSSFVKLGIINAVDVIESITESANIHAAGYCIGGTLLATAQAYMLAKGDNRIKSLSYFTTMLDFSEPGEIGNLIYNDHILSLIKKSTKNGIVDGRIINMAFNMLRENDLIWFYFINNYLKGQKPKDFDLLFWSNDQQNMTFEVVSFLIDELYLENKLSKGEFFIDEIKIDLTIIDTPVYSFAAMADHIVPWTSVYEGIKLFSGDTRFILGGSGHIAGVINPPEQKKYSYWTNEYLSTNPTHWLNNANEHSGSWWDDWKSWLLDHSGEEVLARKVGNHIFKSIEPAPGTYCKKEK